MIDYLIVGQGLAGSCFAEVLERQGKSFLVISDTSQQASVVAGGLYNPVVLKRLNLAWNAQGQLGIALPFYGLLADRLHAKLDRKLTVFRRLASVEEQNRWFEAADKPGLTDFLVPKIRRNTNSNIEAPFGFGEVMHTGRIDTATLLDSYNAYLQRTDRLWVHSFDHQRIQVLHDHVVYEGKRARRIVFAEGYGLVHNPYFNYLPLQGSKGELLTIKAPDLQETKVIKAGVFIIPLGDDLYRIGATYTWKDKTNRPTEAGRAEVVKKLESFLRCDYEITDHVAGVRPTVADRRPLVGQHPEHRNLYVLNGFGSRGVMIGPWAASFLYDHIERQTPLPREMDIARFRGKYSDG